MNNIYLIFDLNWKKLIKYKLNFNQKKILNKKRIKW